MNLYCQYLLTNHFILFSKQFTRDKVVSNEEGGGQRNPPEDKAFVSGRVKPD